MLGIDVGQLHVEEHQDLQRANWTSEAKPDADVDDLQLRERHRPGPCIFSLAAGFYALRFSPFAPAERGRL